MAEGNFPCQPSKYFSICGEVSSIFHQNSQVLHKEFSIPHVQAKQVIKECPDCQVLSKVPPTLGINPRGLQPQMIWQTDVTTPLLEDSNTYMYL